MQPARQYNLGHLQPTSTVGQIQVRQEGQHVAVLRPDLDHSLQPPPQPEARYAPGEGADLAPNDTRVHAPDEGTDLNGGGKTTLQGVADVGGFRGTPPGSSTPRARPRQPLRAGGSAAESGTVPRAAFPPTERSAAPPGGVELNCSMGPEG